MTSQHSEPVIFEAAPVVLRSGVRRYRITLADTVRMLNETSISQTALLNALYEQIKTRALQAGYIVDEYREPHTGDTIIDIIPPPKNRVKS